MQDPQETKTVIFSFDGTGNEPSDAGEFVEDESITNVLKLHLLLGGTMRDNGLVLGDGEGKQIAFYYNGIGTREEGRSVPWLERIVRSSLPLKSRNEPPSFPDNTGLQRRGL